MPQLPPQETAEFDKKRMRLQMTVERVTNGYTVKHYPDFYIFKTLKEALEFMQTYFTEGK